MLDLFYQSARAGNSAAVHRSVLDFSLDVNSPRKKPKQSRKQDDNTPYETLLHVAASYCDESLVSFLLEQGLPPPLRLYDFSSHPLNRRKPRCSRQVSTDSFPRLHPGRKYTRCSLPPQSARKVVRRISSVQGFRCWPYSPAACNSKRNTIHGRVACQGCDHT